MKFSQLEKEANTKGDFPIDSECLYSIAISLKRIADKLELSQKQPIIMSAEEYAKYQGQFK